jgi:PiT family inorganic phosphate transporter
MQLIIIVTVLLLGLYMAWNIGANDFANSMADAVGSGSISIRGAIILGSICEFAGSTLVGAHVTDTIRKGIVDTAHFATFPHLLILGMFCALLSTALWLNIATRMGMPVSTTHAIVGAVAGLGLVSIGCEAVRWIKIGQIVISWFISPLFGGLLSFILFKLITHYILGQKNPVSRAVRYAPAVVFLVTAVVAFSSLYQGLDQVLKNTRFQVTNTSVAIMAVVVALLFAFLSRFPIKRFLKGNEDRSLGEQLQIIEKIFAPLVVITSCSVAFAHGANDVANAMGPVAAVLEILRTGAVEMRVQVPFWILAMGGCGIVLGLSTFGYRVMATIGTKITQLTPSRGVAADIATTVTVLGCSLLKLPVSTTHTIVGAIIGVGMARGLGAINRRVTRDIFGSWLITVPVSGVLTAGLFLLARLLHLDILVRQAISR